MPNPQQPKRNNNTLLIIIIALLAALVIAAVVYIFSSNKSSEETEKAVETTVVAVPAADTAATATPAAPIAESNVKAEPQRESSPYGYVLYGSVGKYKIKVELDVTGESITGRYRYTRKNGAGGFMDLYGTRSCKNFEISEAYNGEPTGYWWGTINTDGDNIRLSGSMQNAKGTVYTLNVKGRASK